MVESLLDVDKYARSETSLRRSRTSSTASKKHDSSERPSFESHTSFDDEKFVGKLRVSCTDASDISFKSISHEDHQHHKFYQATATKPWTLVLFLLAIGICIVLLELAIQFHPAAGSVPELQARNARLQKKRHLHPHEQGPGYALIVPRQNYQESQATSSILVISSSFADAVSTTPSETSSVVPGEPNPVDQLTVTTASSSAEAGELTGAPNPINQLTVTSQPTTSPAGITVGEPAPESQISITRQSISSTISASLLANLGSSIVTSSKAGPSEQTSVATATSSGAAPPEQASTAVGALTLSVSPPATTNAQSADSSTRAHDAIAGPVSGSSKNSQVTTAMVKDNGLTVSTSLSGSYKLAETTIINSGGSVVATTSLVVCSESARPTATIPDSSGNNMAKYETMAFTQFDYFLAMYLPNVISVVLQSSWLVIFASFKMLEPFYQLSRPGGAPAKSTLTADYLSSGLSVSFIKIVLDNHWVLALAGLVQFALALTVLMDAGAFSVVPTAYCKTEISDHQPCDPKWVVNVSLVRAVEVFLVACFSMIISIIVLHRKRRTGVYTDPSRIATMADILVHNPLLKELRDVPPSATKGNIAIDLKESRYALGTFTQDGKFHYGIIKLPRQLTSNLMVSEPWYTKGHRRLGLWWEHMAGLISTTVPFFSDCLCMALIIILFAMILTYRLLPSPAIYGSSFNIWMSSGGNSPRIVLSALACAASYFVKNKERSLRLSYPYILMAKSAQPATECITSGTCATVFTSLLKSFRSLDISLALMAVSVIFIDIVLILIPGIPQSTAQTMPVYLSSTYICLIMLALILVAYARATFKEWRRGPQIECPETLADVFIRLCASHFLEEKNSKEANGTTEFGHDDDEKQHGRYVGADGERRYRFGIMEGVDGVHRYMVDEDVWARRWKEYQ